MFYFKNLHAKKLGGKLLGLEMIYSCQAQTGLSTLMGNSQASRRAELVFANNFTFITSFNCHEQMRGDYYNNFINETRET